MTNPLKEEIKESIIKDGPMAISKYMEFCLLHPVHGYYRKESVLERSGDFTTAPDISPVFGEIIGIWALDWWLKNNDNKINQITLVELGPGRGTLMSDAISAIQKTTGGLPVNVHLVEESPSLKKAQENKLSSLGAHITWHKSIPDLPDVQAIFIANEFFDSLPLDQLILADDMLYHHCVILNDEGDLAFGTGNPVSAGLDIDFGMIKTIAKAGEGTILEVSPHRLFAMEEMATHISNNGGAGIIIDYGFAQPGFGDTFQAIEKDRYVNPLDNPGSAVLTSHVDFPALTQPIHTSGAELCGILTQGDFLTYLGIEERTNELKNAAKTDTLKKALAADCEKLTGKDHMGELFKVMILQSGGNTPPAPFTVE